MFGDEDEWDSVREHKETLIEYERSIGEEFLKSERIPEEEKLHTDKLIAGLMYIDKINPVYGTRSYGFEHDTMYIFADLGDFKEEDILYLYRLGFIINTQDDGFIHF